jgi:hypothetical protein
LPLRLVCACSVSADPTRAHSAITLQVGHLAETDRPHLRILVTLKPTRRIDYLIHLAMDVLRELVTLAVWGTRFRADE